MYEMKQKGLALAIMASLMTTLPGTALAAEQEAASSEVAQMRAEIAALTARLNTLERQLAAQEAKDQKVAKADKSKAPTLKMVWLHEERRGEKSGEAGCRLHRPRVWSGVCQCGRAIGYGRRRLVGR